MNKQQFYHWLHNPQLLNEDTLKPLTEVVQEYPFFQAARMLLIKNLHNIEHIRFNGELKICAAHIANRKQLFELVYKTNHISYNSFTPESSSALNLKPELVENEVAASLPVVEVTGAASEAAVITEDITVLKGEQPAIVDDYFEVTDDLSLFVSAKEVDDSTVGAAEDAIVLPSADLLGFDLQPSASAYSLEEELPPIDLSDEANFSFSDWLNHMRHRRVVSPSGPAPSSSKKVDLIDSFLNQDSFRIVPKPIEEVAKIEDKVKQSVSENDDLLTETLASIYIKQKQFQKAINIFEKLRLKYPEKNTYFATRISDLEKLSKTQ